MSLIINIIDDLNVEKIKHNFWFNLLALGNHFIKFKLNRYFEYLYSHENIKY